CQGEGAKQLIAAGSLANVQFAPTSKGDGGARQTAGCPVPDLERAPSDHGRPRVRVAAGEQQRAGAREIQRAAAGTGDHTAVAEDLVAGHTDRSATGA